MFPECKHVQTTEIMPYWFLEEKSQNSTQNDTFKDDFIQSSRPCLQLKQTNYLAC